MADAGDLSEKCHTFRTNPTRLLSRRTHLELGAGALRRGVHLAFRPHQNRIKSPSKQPLGLSVEGRADSPGYWKD